jgi:hypothetical protein
LPQLWTHLSKVHSQTASPFSYSCLAFSEHTQQNKHERRTRFVLLLHLEKGEEGLNNIVWEKYKWMVREAFLCSLATIYFMESKQLSAILLSKITHRKGEGKQSNIEIQFCSCNILLPGIRRGKHFHLCLFKVCTIFPRYVFKYKSCTTICNLSQFNSTYIDFM